MKITVFALFWVACLLIIGQNVPAQNKTTLQQFKAVSRCLEENEANFSKNSAGKNLNGGKEAIETVTANLPILEKLIGCADKGSKIKGLPREFATDMVSRKKMYISVKELSKTQLKIFKPMLEVEEGIAKSNEFIEKNDYKSAATLLEIVIAKAKSAKEVAEQGIISKIIAAENKSGFRESSENIANTIKMLENLLADVQKKISEF